MSREKQIEKIAKVMCGGCPDNKECMHCLCADWYKAEDLYNAGCRMIQITDWLTRGISEEQLEREREESLKEFFERNCKKYGYCKQSEVVKEIFKEIDNIISNLRDSPFYSSSDAVYELTELKKKYTGEKEDAEIH